LPDSVRVDRAKDKKKMAVRFEATGGNETGAVFGIRMIRADAER